MTAVEALECPKKNSRNANKEEVYFIINLYFCRRDLKQTSTVSMKIVMNSRPPDDETAASQNIPK